MSTHARHREAGGILSRIIHVVTAAFGTALNSLNGSRVSPERPTQPPKEYRP